MIRLKTPVTDEDVKNLKVGDMVLLSGNVFCGRDAVLPRILANMNAEWEEMLRGCAIFHTAVSKAGVGPTSSNKLEIEESIGPLSKTGVKIHIGKGKISKDTIGLLNDHLSVFAVIPPVTALLEDKTLSKELIAYGELGMEAFYKLDVKEYPLIIAAAHGRSIFDE